MGTPRAQMLPCGSLSNVPTTNSLIALRADSDARSVSLTLLVNSKGHLAQAICIADIQNPPKPRRCFGRSNLWNQSTSAIPAAPRESFLFDTSAAHAQRTLGALRGFVRKPSGRSSTTATDWRTKPRSPRRGQTRRHPRAGDGRGFHAEPRGSRRLCEFQRQGRQNTPRRLEPSLAWRQRRFG